MPFDVNVIAISWRSGEYAVVGAVPDHLDWPAVLRDGVIRDVTDTSNIYRDHAGILGHGEIARYANSEAGRIAYEAYLREHPEVSFFMIHQYEWESGMD